jgi:hypothetical protein
MRTLKPDVQKPLKLKTNRVNTKSKHQNPISSKTFLNPHFGENANCDHDGRPLKVKDLLKNVLKTKLNFVTKKFQLSTQCLAPTFPT